MLAKLAVIGVIFGLIGCVPYQSLITFNETSPFPDSAQIISNFQPLEIQPNDILHIDVSSSDQEAASLFRKNIAMAAGGGNAQNTLLNGYLVNSDGTIDFPLLGGIQVGGLTMEEARDTLEQLLLSYFVSPPVVSFRILNFTINITGEVGAPGSIQVPTERFTLVEAITQAGDFTSYARRDSILIIREQQGLRSYAYVDFNSGEVLNSPHFYLKQNDVIYVRPEKRKIGTVRDRETRILPWVSAGTGFVAFIISILSLSRN